MTNNERRDFKKKYEEMPYAPPPARRRDFVETSFTHRMGSATKVPTTSTDKGFSKPKK